MGFFTRSAPSKPEKVPTDTVIPFHYLDDQDYAKALILHFQYRFDDVLDVRKMKAALERLVEMDGWRKLGGRVREGANGKLEYHIPTEYTKERPAFNWTHVTHQTSINDHEIASRLPRTPGDPSRPALFEDPANFADIIYTPSTPQNINDWLYSDAAPLSILITSFSDATLLSLSFGHYLWDALGWSSFMQAWIALLDGREQDVPPMVGYDEDPLDKVGTGVAPEKYVLYDLVLRGWQWWLFVLNMIVEFVWWSKSESRAMFLPGDFVKGLREQAIQDLASANSDTFVSEGDVLLAWWTRLMVKAQGLRPNQPVLIMNVSNMRGLLDEALPAGAAYLGNAVMTANTLLTTNQLLNQSLGQTALQIRNDLLAQRTTEQVHAWVALHKHMYRSIGRAPMVGISNMSFHAFSNWHRARFLDMDFSAAVMKTGCPLEERSNEVGKASYVNVTGRENGFATRNSGPIIGSDARGDWWMSWKLRASVWERVEGELGLKGEGKKER